jgi:phosphatidylglycerophosphatase A
LDLVEVVVQEVLDKLELLRLLVLVVLVLEFPLHFTTQHLPQDLEQDHKLVVV